MSADGMKRSLVQIYLGKNYFLENYRFADCTQDVMRKARYVLACYHEVSRQEEKEKKNSNNDNPKGKPT